MELGPRAGAGPLAGKASSWGLAAESRSPRVGGGWCWFLTQLAAVSGVSQSLCWPTGGQCLGPVVPGLELFCWWMALCPLAARDWDVPGAVFLLVGEASHRAWSRPIGGAELVILGLVPAYCWVEIGSRVSGLDLVPVHWCGAWCWPLWWPGPCSGVSLGSGIS